MLLADKAPGRTRRGRARVHAWQGNTHCGVCAQIPAVEEAKQLSAKIESTVRDISKINVPGVSRHSDAQLDQMAGTRDPA
jgi:hypothetical protein